MCRAVNRHAALVAALELFVSYDDARMDAPPSAYDVARAALTDPQAKEGQ